MSEQCAYHEAGHAVVAYRYGAKVHSISIEPDWDDEALRNDGDIEVHWPMDRYTQREIHEFSIYVALGGPAAEMIYTGDVFHPGLVHEWSQDWNTAWELAGRFHSAEARRLRYLEATTRDLYQLLSQDTHWQAIASLSDELLAHEHMEADEVHDVLKTWLG